MFDTNKVAKNIKKARTEKNMTQMDLADAMGVSYQAVSNWERGKCGIGGKGRFICTDPVRAFYGEMIFFRYVQ